MSTELDYEMEYNTAREPMQIPEYGRNIQKMIEFAKTIEDKDERNKAAKSIIKVMGQVNPALKNLEGLTHKIWDHMFIISGFDFDVDSPFPKPLREDFELGPDQIPYPDSQPKYRHYGKVVIQMAKKVAVEENEENRNKMGVAIANVMKRAYLNWNRDSVEDRVIKKDLLDISEGKIALSAEIDLAPAKDLIDPTLKAATNNKHKRKGGRNNNNNNNNNRKKSTTNNNRRNNNRN
ncbi:MAG: hypothetical protein ACI9UR_000688 [Bacteroidia bacterium]|jgi:hypothetical protein